MHKKSKRIKEDKQKKSVFTKVWYWFLVIAIGMLFGKHDGGEQSMPSSVNSEVAQDKGQVNKVIESAKKEQLKYSSNAEKAYIKNINKKDDFLTYADGMYHLTSKERINTYDTFVSGKGVIWEGIVVNKLSDSVIVYAGNQTYHGEDWATLTEKYKELLPYVFIAELTYKEQLANVTKGEKIKVIGLINSKGDKETQKFWRLNKSEIVD